MKRFFQEPRLYVPPNEGDQPPGWVRWVLMTTCGAVSFAHGSNDGQKGMGLILLSLIGFLPTYYALDMHHPFAAKDVLASANVIRDTLRDEGLLTTAIRADLDIIDAELEGKSSFTEVRPEKRWRVRQAIFRFRENLGQTKPSHAALQSIASHRKPFAKSIEYVPFWVTVGVALALGAGTMIGYQRIVVTVAEKIGKSHLTYAQGAAAELVAAMTIGLADVAHMPVSTTHVLSSGVAGTMWANRSGIQGDTVRKIGLAWILTLPAAILLSATLFTVGGYLLRDAPPPNDPQVKSQDSQNVDSADPPVNTTP
jgi:phosphate/sulfate permease